MTKYVEVAVNVGGVQGVYDYRIPDMWSENVSSGILVEVPFQNANVQGVITRVKDSASYTGEIKEVVRLVRQESVEPIPQAYIRMAEEMADRYLQPISGFLTAMLPAGSSRKPYILYEATAPDDADLQDLSKLQTRLVDRLTAQGDLRSTQLDRIFSRQNWRKAMQLLISRGWVQKSSILPAPRIVSKKETIAALHPDVLIEEIDQLNIGVRGGKAADRKRRALHVLAKEEEPVPVSYLYASAGINSSDIRYLAEKGLILTGKHEVVRDPTVNIFPEGTQKPVLTDDQEAGWKIIKKSLLGDDPKPILLHGITGSGKTELYMRAAEEVVSAGKQAVILVPEISLTPQTIQRFLDRFPDTVGVIHSRMSDGERYDTWQRVSRGEIDVLIGPRSALFTPLPALGLIVMDECHDDSYFQQGRGPYYSTEEAAIALANETGACLILGSATPNITQYFRMEREGWKSIQLNKRIGARRGKRDTSLDHLPLPGVEVVDMRKELRAGNSSIFSMELQKMLKSVTAAKQQAILFLNRRGSSTIIFCRDCGFTARCPHCDFPLTHHMGDNSLLCHTCGYSRKMFTKCPDCGSDRIRQYGLGTERVERELKRLIPNVRTLRWDADTASGKQSEAIILNHFKRHNADVLIGTQMLAKGLDLPLVTLVGVVLADVGLNFPDYRASERAFQLLTQVAGRAGRSRLGGKAILQTFEPEHYAIQFAAEHDYSGFYQEELKRRREIQYPPYTHLVHLETRDLYAENAERKAEKLAEEIRIAMQGQPDKSLQLIGPAPPYFARQFGYYRWQIIIKGNNPRSIIDGFNLTGWRISIDPPHIL